MEPGQDDVRKKPKYNENLPLANTDEFRSRRQALLKIREVENDVRMAQSACHNLDEKAVSIINKNLRISEEKKVTEFD